MLEYIKNQKYYIFFIIVSFCFLIIANSMSVLDYLSTYAILFGLMGAALFAIYAFFFLLKIRDKKSNSKLLDALFAISIINFLAMFIFAGSLLGILLNYNINAFYTLVIGALIMLSVAFPLFLGAYLVREKKYAYLGYLIFAIVIILAMFYFLSGTIIKSYIVDDEFFISIRDIKNLLSGINPYQYSIAQQIYSNRTSIGWTLTTNNQIMGILNYPALYLLSYVPFYFASSPTVFNIDNHIAPLQAAVFLLTLLFVIAFAIDKKYLKSPLYGLLIMLPFLFLSVASLTTYLMLALLIIAYVKTGSRYSWIFFGLCISIQELLWVPIILLLAYTINNYGFKKGIYDVIGMAFVFLLINGYFIALSPLAFFNGIFNPIEKLLLPIANSSFFGFFLLSNYHVLLGVYTAVFGLIILLMIVAYLYLNKKILVGLFSMVPLLFLSRSLVSYYIFFVLFIFITILIAEGKQKHGIIETYLHNKKYVLSASVCLLAILLVGAVYLSHIAYSKQFNITVSNQSLHYDALSNESIYTAQMSYRNLSNQSMYIIFYGYANNQQEIIGIFNDSIINSSVKCTTNGIACLNVNKIVLSNSSGTYHITAHLANASNGKIEGGRLMVYNGQYFYVADSVSNSNALKLDN
jgi:hypothetical protein